MDIVLLLAGVNISHVPLLRSGPASIDLGAGTVGVLGWNTPFLPLTSGKTPLPINLPGELDRQIGLFETVPE